MLITMLLVGICIALFPMTRTLHRELPLRMEQLKHLLLLQQEMAMQEGTTIQISFQGTTMQLPDREVELHMTCRGTLTFHPNGNVDQAKRISCHNATEQASLVIQLGSGRMYVEK